ncbi:tyrosine-type recombinase/integrase [Rhodococcus ruber]|uniref:Tyrosine-type recombinase/integrase n=1 Tax=Rhodococcus ruber TaxID=1830 RepID=A0ABT4MEW2_9NOCA|nr:tyrosine-type recombinase/integrase [Rhodococcus ruber]MCZ4519512.1 tyrosine-type recombinase/integrase [Rhodococcus ruber]
MAYVRKIETSRTKNSKPVPSYQVRWQEPARDEMGRPIPVSSSRPDGQTKQVHLKETFGSKEAAQERCDELNAQRHRTTAQSASEIRKAGDQPFGHYAAAWLESMEVKVARGQLKERTLSDYRKLLHRYVLDRFGGQAVATITARQCEEFLAALVRQQSRQGADGVLNNRLTPATIKHAWSTFGRVLKYAMRHDAIPSNPADRVDFAGKRSTGDHDRFEHHPLTAAQVSAVSNAVAGEVDGLPAYPIYALMVDFLAYSGIRAAENAGLEVGDLAFTTGPARVDGSPTVRCAVQVRRTKDRKNGQWVSSTPKSRKSRRTVPLPTWLAERMRAYLAEHHPRANEPTAPLWPSRKNGGGYRAAGERYAVPLDWSRPLAMGAFYDTIFRPALVSVGLPASAPSNGSTPATRGVRLHDLRHTFATMQLMAGTHFMQVSKWLGHSTFTLTLDTYGDWIPEEDGGAGNNLPEPTAVLMTPTAEPSNVVPLFGKRSG